MKLDMTWMNGRLTEGEAPVVLSHDGKAEPTLCITTTRVRSGRPCWTQRHIERIRRDAAIIGLDPPSPELCRQALEELAAAAFSEEDGILRLEAGRETSGEPRLVCRARAFRHEPVIWRAITAKTLHPGPDAFAGAKLFPRAAYAAAADEARRAGVDEALLFDATGHLVEGSRSNLLVVLADGRILAPPLANGAVAGIARDLCFEVLPELIEETVGPALLGGAAQLIATNAVRGAVPILELDGQWVGDGEVGPWGRRLMEDLRPEPD